MATGAGVTRTVRSAGAGAVGTGVAGGAARHAGGGSTPAYHYSRGSWTLYNHRPANQDYNQIVCLNLPKTAV